MNWKCIAAFALFSTGYAQQHEVGLTLGGVVSSQRSASSTKLDLGAGTGLQANYGYRVHDHGTWALFGELHFLASPLREVASADRAATRDFASLYVTPGIRVKFAPRSRVAPYGAIGGGWALYEQSTNTLAGGANPAPRFAHRGALQFGGGVDIRLWRFVGFRGDVRDFYTGAPIYNIGGGGGQHNVAVSGGIVLQFGE